MRNIIIVLFFLLSVLTAGAENNSYILKTDPERIVSPEFSRNIPVVDYSKVRKGVSAFNFYPVYFYVSSDGCNSPIEKLNKDDAINIELCAGFNVIDDFHHLRFELITPDNATYQSISLFVDKPEAVPKLIKYGENYTPFKITKPVIMRGVSIVNTSMPIAGSSIQSQNLVGKWRINLFIDDSSDASGTLTFEIE